MRPTASRPHRNWPVSLLVVVLALLACGPGPTNSTSIIPTVPPNTPTTCDQHADGTLWLAQAGSTVQFDPAAKPPCVPLDANTVYTLHQDGLLYLDSSPWPVSSANQQKVDTMLVASLWAQDRNAVLLTDPQNTEWADYGPWTVSPSNKSRVDGGVSSAQAVSVQGALSAAPDHAGQSPRPSFQVVYVLHTDGSFWVERGPFPSTNAQQLASSIIGFQALDANTVYVEDIHDVLYLESGSSQVWVDGNVEAFQALDANTTYVLGFGGALWLEHAPWGATVPGRVQVDGNVTAFQALDANTVFVLGSDGKLWLEHGPWGHVPPTRDLVDSGVSEFQAAGPSPSFHVPPPPPIQ